MVNWHVKKILVPSHLRFVENNPTIKAAELAWMSWFPVVRVLPHSFALHISSIFLPRLTRDCAEGRSGQSKGSPAKKSLCTELSWPDSLRTTHNKDTIVCCAHVHHHQHIYEKIFRTRGSFASKCWFEQLFLHWTFLINDVCLCFPEDSIVHKFVDFLVFTKSYKLECCTQLKGNFWVAHN